MFWKSHHALMDGASIMSFNLAMSEDYGREYFVKSKDLSFIQRLLLKLSIPLQLPVLALNIYKSMKKIDLNMITKNKHKICGLKNCVASEELHFDKVKTLSKQLGMTINDLVTSSISTSMYKLFQENNDSQTEVQMVIPVNIRYEFYPTPEKVKIENKFTALPLILPLCESM